MTGGRVADKVCVVTGGAQGIGFAVARALAGEGAAVVIADVGAGIDGEGVDAHAAAEAARTVEDAGGTCLGLSTDVGDPAATDALVATTVERFGRVDVLVNAAGNLRRGSILDMSWDDWDATMRTHVHGFLNTTRSVAALWRHHPGRGRRVISFSSDSGLYGDAEYASYAAAKAAVVALCLGAADTLGPLGATANVFIPQAKTRMTASIPAELLPDTEAERWRGDEFSPDHVPPALVFLASDASEGITGRIVGGWGYEVHSYAMPRRTKTLASAGPWDLAALFAHAPALFGE